MFDFASICDVAKVVGAIGPLSASSFLRAASLSIPFFLKKTLIVVRSALFGLQSSALTGSCKQTGQACGSEDWPISISVSAPNIYYQQYVLTGFAD